MFSRDIRKKFKGYFTSHTHHWQNSAPLIPEADSSLLFVNAGMNPFKDYFLGLKSYALGNNVCSIQKCLRVSGKHNDLEEVGSSPWHHTYFEMLGSFSFGGYGKKMAMDYALQFLVKELGLDKDRLLVSVFKEDRESYEIWKKDFHFPPEKIFVLGEQDNFWRMGKTGLCGPCTEIYYNLCPDKKKPSLSDSLEIWNLVFMSFNNTGSSFIKLPKVCIDTGMGMERLAMILQKKSTNYETDLFSGMIDEMKNAISFSNSKISLDRNRFYKLGFFVLADHARAVAFLLSEGLRPSGEARGYVLRKILRRASYYDQKIGESFKFRGSLLGVGIKKLISTMAKIYPELKKNENKILETTKTEQQKFFQTLYLGRQLLEEKIRKLKAKNQNILDGKEVFVLYDTYGFPFELTSELAGEQKIQVDEKGFQKEIRFRKESSKKKQKGEGKNGSFSKKEQNQMASLVKSISPTQFIGYNQLKLEGEKVQLQLGFFYDSSTKSLIKKKLFSRGQRFYAIMDKTPFYPEGGGQVGDRGKCIGPKGNANVLSSFKVQDHIIHEMEVRQGQLQNKEMVQLELDVEKREATTKHHSATHLLHSALRAVLGEKLRQAGSLVDENKLRFDFTYDKPLKDSELREIEALVNKWIKEAWPVETKLMDLKQAIDEGALAFFEDHYGDKNVRVLKMGPRSKELCGGTHVSNTKNVLLFLILGEGGIGAGVRRIEAVAGDQALKKALSICWNMKEVYKVLNLGSPFKEKKNTLLNQIQKLRKKIKEKTSSAKHELSFSKSKKERLYFDKLKKALKIHYMNFENTQSVQDLRDALDMCKSKALTLKDQENLFIVVGAYQNGFSPLVLGATKAFSLKTIALQNILQSLISDFGGKGGGKPHFAQGKVHASYTKIKEAISAWLKNHLETL